MHKLRAVRCVQGLKSLVSHHNLTVTHKSLSRKTLRQIISNHIAGAEGNELDDTSKGKFTHVVSTNVSVSGVLSVDWISHIVDMTKTAKLSS